MSEGRGRYVYDYPRPMATVDVVVLAGDLPGRDPDRGAQVCPQALLAGQTLDHPGPELCAPAKNGRDKGLRVLLIKRRRDPFTGAWALPGGYLDENEDPAAGAGRELWEETGLEGLALRELGFFGRPGRDPRGWTITLAFWALAGEGEVRAGDDAAEAAWFPADALPPLAFDHGEIIARAVAAMSAGPV